MTKLLGATLCFIFDENSNCLMLKREREPHRGQWNAPGGKLLQEEDPEQGCLREVLEETGLVLSSLRDMGCIDCIDLLDPANAWRLYLFVALASWVPVPPSPEGVFAWLELGTILAGGREIVHNIPLILPLLLQGIPIRGEFVYRQDYLEKYKISLVSRSKGLPIC